MLPDAILTASPAHESATGGTTLLSPGQDGLFLASPYGGSDADVWGELGDAQSGEVFGRGGLGHPGLGRDFDSGEPTLGLDSKSVTGSGSDERVPRVRSAAPKVSGPLGNEVVRRVVRAHITEVLACYTQALAHDPELEGRVLINFVITPTGSVGSSVVKESTIPPPAGICIAKAIKRWKFPTPEGGRSAIVDYPFTLSPG